MKSVLFAGAVLSVLLGTAPAFADDSCSNVAGDVVLSVKTPQVDLYDGANGKVVKSLDADKFPACTPITARAPNMMMEVNVEGTNYWVPPHMVNTRMKTAGKPICRNLAMGGDTEKVGSTRGLGEGCPKTGSSTQ